MSDADRYDHAGDPRAYARAARATEPDAEPQPKRLRAENDSVTVSAERLAMLQHIAAEVSTLLVALGRLSVAIERLEERP